MDHTELTELTVLLESVAGRLTDLTYVALREQAEGNSESKERERKLSSARRSVIKAAQLLRAL